MGDTTETIQYRHIPEGCGGLFAFYEPPNESQDPQENIRYIGTIDCISCVALYLPLAHTRDPTVKRRDPDVDDNAYATCYCAHIRAAKAGHTGNTVSPAEGARIKAEVLKRLQSSSTMHGGWELDNSNNVEVFIVCPDYEDEVMEEVKTTGWYVIKAIKEHLGLPAGHPVIQDAQGS